MPKRYYKVIGAQEILGHPPGETFKADIPEDQEAFLKQIGAIRPVSKPPKDPDAAVAKAAEELADEQEAAKRPPDAQEPAA